LDSGIDPNHPDIRRNVDRDLSRNFTRDIPSIGSPCRDERDRSCDDPHLGDPAGHGTAVASMVAAPLNDTGISGVAPNVTLVSLRVGQESGFIFVQPVVDALTYAADNAIDIANLSFWIDPWWLNCPSNPADSPEAQQDQQTTIAAVQAAVDYARGRGVTIVVPTANDWTDLDNPMTDTLSPTFPLDSSTEREVDDTCLLLPVEADGVIGVSGVGPSGRKAFYSNYGLDATDVAAPSGDDFDDTLQYPSNLVLAAFPKAPLRRFGLLDRDGRPTIPEVMRQCSGRRCSYYVFIGGTSFAGPTAAGVAALIVSAHGSDDGAGGVTMAPAAVERILYETARPHACPEGGVQEYPEIGDKLVEFGLPSWEAFTATCTEGPGQTNGFFGHGLVNAYDAVTYRP
ncbi:MAG: S8 family serine peptidase, partial [Actinomycetota bacterium]|nr:S8 family serine peptidase [Actinomycetota bacterium]